MTWNPDVFCKCANCGDNIYIGQNYYKLPLSTKSESNI